LAGTYTDPEEVVDQLNDQLSATFDGIEFFLSGSGTSSLLGVQTTYAYGPEASIELVSVTSSLYGPSSVVGMGTLMSAAALTGTVTQYPSTSVPDVGHYDFSGFTANSLNLQIVIDGTDNVLIDNVVQTVVIPSSDQDISDVVSAINDAIDDGDIPGGFVASSVAGALKLTTLHVGNDAKLLVKSASTADTLLGLANTTNSGDSGSPCVSAPGATYSCGIVTGSVNSLGTICFTITADSQGVDGNNTKVVIKNSLTSSSFTLEVYSYGSQVESWGGLVKDPTSSKYVESFIATVSNYIRVVDNTDTLALPLAASSSSPYSLSGGTDGIPADPSDQDDLLIGSLTSMTGLQALSDTDQVNIDLVAVPGHTSTAIAQGLIDFTALRGDCFAIVEAPFGLNVNEVIQWQNGTHPLNDTRFDSNYAALYWPWVMIRDAFNHINVWVPPSGGVLSAFANSDSISAPWFAPAGQTRGLVQDVLDVFTRPTLEERDQMYGNANAVNPIVQFVDLEGFYVWGQKTLQRTPGPLDRVNVRRMLLYVEKQIRNGARSLLFEPNNTQIQTQFVNMATAILELVRSQGGLTDYVVSCDDTLNTPDVIERNELRAQIGIQPIKATEFILIEFAMFATGSFAESAF
jgi:phage tail sheath protein FI